MNDASDQSVKKEATPLVVGGEVSKPTRLFNKKRWIKIGAVVAVVVVIIAAAVAGWWFFLRTDPGYLDISKLNSQDTHVAKAQQYAKQSLPSKSEDLAMRYGLIAAYLYAGKEYTYSEHYYLTAQKTVEQRKLNQKDYRFYQGLSDTYEKLGNKAKAEQYKQKEKDAIKVNYSAKEIQQMEEMKLNGRSR